MDFITSVIFSFITIFFVMDPFASLPPFLALTKKCKDEAELKSTATKAVVIAGILALLFVFGGINVLSVLSITLPDFRVAGGIVLVLMGLENVLGFSFSKTGNNDLYSAAVLIATPMLTGPGLITSLILLVHDLGIIPVLISLIAALLLSWVVLINAFYLKNILGVKNILILSKIIGLFLMAMGISHMKAGVLG